MKAKVMATCEYDALQPTNAAMSAREKRKLMAEISAMIGAPVDEVWPLLVESLPGASAESMTLVQQGGWWYRGEWAAHPVQHDTRITHRVYNVAGQMRWSVPLANKFFIGFNAKIRSAFEHRVAMIATRLDTTFHIRP